LPFAFASVDTAQPAPKATAVVPESKSQTSPDSDPRGVLRLGAMESKAAVRLPAPLPQLQSRHRELAVELLTGDPARLVADVLRCAQRRRSRSRLGPRLATMAVSTRARAGRAAAPAIRAA
jgi:hypothetical protein